MQNKYYWKTYKSNFKSINSKHIYKTIDDYTSELVFCSKGKCDEGCIVGDTYIISESPKKYLSRTEIILYTKGER